MSAKSKSSSSDTPTKVSPATPRVASKVSRGLAKPEPGSPSPLQSARNSADRSQILSLNSTPTVVRRSPKVATPPEEKTGLRKEKQINYCFNYEANGFPFALSVGFGFQKPQTRVGKGLELQAQLNSKKKAAEEANDKLREALAAQKLAEENSEIEKFRTLELEQVEMDAAQKKDEEWKIEIESVRNQHALDVAALVSTTQELQRVKQELAMACDTKNQALNHADDATKIAEIHAEKAEILSAELVREEIESLKQEVEKAKAYEEKLVENEAFVEQLNVDLEAAKMAESYTRNVVDEWGNKVEKLEMQIGEAKKLERSTSESLNAVMKQLESTNDSLQDAESEIASLKEKVRSFEMTISTQRRDLEKSEHQINTAKEESAEARKLVESLKSELETVKEEKTRALDNEKLAVSRVQTLLEEKSKLFNELENSKDEEEKSKKAMESLASALHEVSAEAREAKEKLLSCETNNEKYETQLEELRLFLKETDEKYKTMLDDAKNEIDLLTNTIEQSKNEHQNSITEWEQKELHLVDCVKKSDEENSSLQKEINRLVNLLKQSEEEATASKEEEARLKDSLKEVESKVIYLQEALEELKTESMKLKESLLDKETELRSVIQEASESKEEEARLKDCLKEVESKVIYLQEALEEVKTESMKLKESLLDKETELRSVIQEASKGSQDWEHEIKESLLDKETELQSVIREASESKEEETRLKDSLKEIDIKNELQSVIQEASESKEEETRLKDSLKEVESKSVIQENDELRAREVASLKKVEELSKLLEEAIIKKQSEENEENGHGSKDKPKSSGEHPEESKIESSPHVNDGSKDEALQADSSKVLNMNGKVVHETKEKENDSVESVILNLRCGKAAESKRRNFHRRGTEQEESFDEEVDSKADASEGFDQVNGSTEIVDDGGNSPSKQQQHKKKKPLLLKFGNLLRRREVATRSKQ
ncbi:F-box protein CPR30-like [Hibiscus syriacus]|uniref:F-box protein CPR30-like n=1 Tax=Hibiscus syriacus TaxID=106335 RepID=A0A6A2YJQ7_HIBSY|nr:F-box protein CPR30-like [Hibiscus syriacus]